MRYEPGQVIRFTYNHPPEGVDANTGDRSKEVLVLNPNYQGKVHGIDLRRLTQAERDVLDAILDPTNVQDPKAPAPKTASVPAKQPVSPGSLHGKATSMSQMSPEKKAEMLRLYGSPAQKAQASKATRQQQIPLVRDILKRMNPLKEIKSPVVFYVKFVRPFLRNKDAYRQYWPSRMLNVSVVKGTNVAGKVVNPKPLFKKVETKPTPFQPSMSAFARKPGSPEEVARQERMAAAKKERERIEKARAAAKAQYQAKRQGLGKVVKPSVTRPPRNK